MKYYINKTITANFDQAIELVTEALKKKVLEYFPKLIFNKS
jgi:hypothetical protein